MSRFGEFNTVARALFAATWLALGCAGAVFADDVRKWRDTEGNLHYSITGSPADSPDHGEGPILQGRGASPEEAFSVESSLQRREIEEKLTAAGRALEDTRTRIQDTEKKEFGAWVPAVTRDPRAAQASLDAQRDALLASQQFEQEKSDTLRRLRRREREQLKAIVGLWRDFGVLDAKVIDHYGKPPIWWRKRLDCGLCPTLAETEQRLHRAPPTPTSDQKTAEEEFSEGSEDEDDEEGWENAWD